MKTRGGAAPRAGHPLGDAEAERVSRLANRRREAIVEKVPVDCPVQGEEIGAGQPLEVGDSQIRCGGADIFQDREEPFAAFHLLELEAAEQSGESLRHRGLSEGESNSGREIRLRHIIRLAGDLARAFSGGGCGSKNGLADGLFRRPARAFAGPLSGGRLI